MNSPVEYVESTAQMRRNLIVAAVTAFFLGLAIVYLRTELVDYIKHLPRCDQVRWFRILLIILLAPVLAIGLWLIHYARKLRAFDQMPLPGTWVWRRTRVIRGRQVLIRSRVLVALGAFSMILAIAGTVVMGPFVRRASETCSAKTSIERTQ